jgi:hypothetical protein
MNSPKLVTPALSRGLPDFFRKEQTDPGSSQG